MTGQCLENWWRFTTSLEEALVKDPTSDAPHSRRLRIVAFLQHPLGLMVAAVTATMLWGSAFPFVKVGYAIAGIRERATFLQLEFAGYRFTLAALLLIGGAV